MKNCMKEVKWGNIKEMYPGCNVFVGQKKIYSTNLAEFAAITVMADFISYINSCGK